QRVPVAVRVPKSFFGTRRIRVVAVVAVGLLKPNLFLPATSHGPYAGDAVAVEIPNDGRPRTLNARVQRGPANPRTHLARVELRARRFPSREPRVPRFARDGSKTHEEQTHRNACPRHCSYGSTGRVSGRHVSAVPEESPSRAG